jgi:HlyD family secretion protein
LDVQRSGIARKKKIRTALLGALALIGVAAISVALARLEPAAPTVEAATVWSDTVKQGLMLRQVRGLGTLVAEETLYIPATTAGRVERIWLLPGAEVRPDSAIVTLSNPELAQQALDAENQVRIAEAQLQNLEVTLESDTLNQKAEFARVESDKQKALLQFERDQKLFDEQLLTALDYELSKAETERLAARLEIEKERLKIRDRSVDAQMAVKRAEIDTLRALLDLRRSQVKDLNVRAGVQGVLQELPVEVGQSLAPGAVIARVAQPERLKAQLRIPETQAKDVVIGQKADIDTRNGIISGRVWRIDPAAREGTVTVDVKLEGELPTGARPDLSVDGTIEVERLTDAVYVGRPASGQPDSLMSLFRIDATGQQAHRVQVRFGKASVNTIEVLEGLNVGDKVVLSDMAEWDSYDRVRLD